MRSMFERFTSSARQVVVRAQEEARRAKWSQIEGRHLLLGLVSITDDAATELHDRGATVDAVRALVGEGDRKTEAGGHIPFTKGAKKILELALREALRLGHNVIAPAHIGMSMLRDTDMYEVLVNELGIEPLALGDAFERIAGREAGVRTRSRLRGLARRRALIDELPVAPPPADRLLLDALRDPGSPAARALAKQGVDPAALAETMAAAAMTEKEADEAAARGSSLDIDGEDVVLRIPHAALVEAITAGIGPKRGDEPGAAEAFEGLVEAVRAAVERLGRHLAA